MRHSFWNTFGVRVVQLLICSGGVSSIAWAFVAPRFRDAEGFAKGEIGLPITLGVALFILGIAIAGSYLRVAAWLALALVGQAVALQLINAGSLIHYQHYKPLTRVLTEGNLLLIAYLVAQTVLVVVGLRRHWTQIHGWLSSKVKILRLVGVSIVFVLSSAALSRDIAVYISELVFATIVQAVSLGTLFLVVWSIPEERLLFHMRRKQADQESRTHDEKHLCHRVDRRVLLAAITLTILAAFLAYYSYERHPHLADEVVYLHHARYLAAGMLTMATPPVPEAFDIYLMEVDGDKWYATPPPGWPIVLSIGALVGLPWLVNPVLAGLNVLLAFLLIQEMFDRSVARWSVLLLCTSPWHVFMAMNFMTHTLTLTCALLAGLGVLWARKTDHARWAGLAGCAIGLASLIRPLEGLILGALIGAWAVGIGGRRLRFSSIAALVLGTVTVGACVLPYNKLLTGNATIHPIMAYTDKHFGVGTNALGFGPNRGLGWPLDPYPGHGPLDAAVNANLNVFSLNTELFGWSVGSLTLIALFVLSGSLKRNDYLMVAVVAAVFGAHIFYWYSGGPDFGARYWFLMLIPCVVLTARGIKYLQSTVQSDNLVVAAKNARVAIAVLLLCVLALTNYFPWRAVDKYHHYLGMRPDVRYVAKNFNFGRSLVLIRGEQFPDYASAFVYNPLDLNADAPVYALDRDPQITARLLQFYSDRPVWIVNGPTITKRGYEIVAGPEAAANIIMSWNNSN